MGGSVEGSLNYDRQEGEGSVGSPKSRVRQAAVEGHTSSPEDSSHFRYQLLAGAHSSSGCRMVRGRLRKESKRQSKTGRNP